MSNKLSAMSKEFCKRCVNEYFGDEGQWTKHDDDRWDRGYVYCPNGYDVVDTDSSVIPPKDCPYQLEHMMATQERIVQ